MRPEASEKLAEICLTLLKFVSSHRGLTCVQPSLTHISYDNYDEYTRRQFVAKAPSRNPYGDEEEPNKFAEFDVFTKIRVLHQLSTWTLNNAERMRGLMEEKDSEQTQWVCAPQQSYASFTNIIDSASKNSAGTLRIAPTLYWTMIAYTVAPRHRYHLHLPRSRKQRQRPKHASHAALVLANASSSTTPLKTAKLRKRSRTTPRQKSRLMSQLKRTVSAE